MTDPLAAVAGPVGVPTTAVAAPTPPPRREVNNFGDTRSGGLAGPVGLLIVVLLAVATVLLIRNMNARLRRLPREFGNATNTPGGPSTVE
ncbi:hypothetical protein GCM10010123_38790 [Pilimelia anulata]|uniref:Uncharacterized protein n=1 Tax=Pilimelia anulata TaxID=53371 RepID=A0A8J3BCK9_9ACTN|nr:hypothetical protein [Pilimelia anulata]GGK05165.1 hypothetical protein GCM10010123_38790 [Pilimelia anulata]